MKLIEIRILIPMSFVATGIHFSQGQCYAIWTKENTQNYMHIKSKRQMLFKHRRVFFFYLEK